jgi:hypothetical protein
MCQSKYLSYYWNNINVLQQSFFSGGTDFYDMNGNVAGQLLLNLFGTNTDNKIIFKEDFMFIFNNGSMGFSFGLDQNKLLTNFTSMAGVVSDKSGIYTNIESITYYFEKINPTQWKITFRLDY